MSNFSDFKDLNLKEKSFGIEIELTMKLSKIDLKFYEVGISYFGRTYAEGKKIGIKEIDLVIDMVGGQACVDAVKVLAWNGRIIIVGFASGSIPEIPANRLLLKNAKADGLYWGEYAYRYPKKIEEDFLVMQKLYIEKKIKPSIDREFSLKDAAKALKYLIGRKNLGKVILKCQS